MNQKVIRIIVLLSSVSLLAALITQLLWVRDAWQLKEDQFNSKIDIALKSVVNQLMTSNDFPSADIRDFEEDFYLDHQQILQVVNPLILDSLLAAELNDMRVEDEYTYGVFRHDDEAIVMGRTGGFFTELIQSPHWVSLTCLCEDETYYLSIYFPYQQSIILNSMIILPVMSGIFLLVLVFSFFFTIYSLIRQKKLSDIKTDFVNNMTHEFKTPISTISITSEMLMKDRVIENSDKVKKYAKIIFDENSRLKNQVEGVLQIAVLEKHDYKLKMKEMDLHEVIRSCSENFNMQMQERKGKLILDLNAENAMITADRVHLSNIINNLLDNANKYSPENPEITIATRNHNGHIQVDVIDKGIGISRENQQDVFKKFHRLQTGDIHDVKGFGLGLFYVKTMTEEMGGTIELKSELSSGSCFTLEFPL
jgi:two-component system phosphate regulon sensor histidine kinase PhoR